MLLIFNFTSVRQPRRASPAGGLAMPWTRVDTTCRRRLPRPCLGTRSTGLGRCYGRDQDERERKERQRIRRGKRIRKERMGLCLIQMSERDKQIKMRKKNILFVLEVGYIWDSNALILVSMIEAIHQDKYQNLKIIYVLVYGHDTLE